MGTGERSVSVAKRCPWASAVARRARWDPVSAGTSRSVHIRPLGVGVHSTTASTWAPLAVRTGRVIRTLRSRRSSSRTSPPRSVGTSEETGSDRRSSSP